ncbi:MAG: hypothetical protein B7X35_02715 [Halothiobacillus sp. 14-56-357]|nr:MAG: hypothetical protein B7X35_02715 [Halothiobacillus sp. 14-56-357]
MSDVPFRLTSLNTAHDRAAFNSGSEPLDRYLQECLEKPNIWDFQGRSSRKNPRQNYAISIAYTIVQHHIHVVHGHLKRFFEVPTGIMWTKLAEK